jgi:hypothetical protein
VPRRGLSAGSTDYDGVFFSVVGRGCVRGRGVWCEVGDRRGPIARETIDPGIDQDCVVYNQFVRTGVASGSGRYLGECGGRAGSVFVMNADRQPREKARGRHRRQLVAGREDDLYTPSFTAPLKVMNADGSTTARSRTARAPTRTGARRSDSRGRARGAGRCGAWSKESVGAADGCVSSTSHAGDASAAAIADESRNLSIVGSLTTLRGERGPAVQSVFPG